MKFFFARLLLLGNFIACAALYSMPGMAQSGLFGGGDQTTPHLTLVRPEIAIDIPTPVQGNDLAQLLALAQQGQGLSAIKQQAAQKFSDHLSVQLERELREFFKDEDVPLYTNNESLTLHSFFDISINKQLNALKTSKSYELERGQLSAAGNFYFQLRDPGGKVLQERRLDIADLRLKEKYQVKTPNDGSAIEDNSDEKIRELLEDMVSRLVDRNEDYLEAGALRELVTTR